MILCCLLGLTFKIHTKSPISSVLFETNYCKFDSLSSFHDLQNNIIVEVQNSQIYSVYAECNKFALRFGIYFYVTVQTNTKESVYIFF